MEDVSAVDKMAVRDVSCVDNAGDVTPESHQDAI